MLIILFGLAGSGKNFVGEIFHQHPFSFEFMDGDHYLTQEMRDAIASKQSFTQDMRDQFTEELIDKISKSNAENLVVASAFYKEKNRQQLLAAFPDAKLILIEADLDHIQNRLLERNDIGPDYAKKIKINFEQPIDFHGTILNNAGKEEVIEQIETFFPEIKRNQLSIRI